MFSIILFPFISALSPSVSKHEIVDFILLLKYIKFEVYWYIKCLYFSLNAHLYKNINKSKYKLSEMSYSVVVCVNVHVLAYTKKIEVSDATYRAREHSRGSITFTAQIDSNINFCYTLVKLINTLWQFLPDLSLSLFITNYH